MKSAELVDLGDDVFRVTHSLPWALDHVHCYALASTAGWTIIDCGLRTPSTLEHWQTVLDTLGGSVERIVITHYHPDHLGAAAALLDLAGPREVVQGELDARLAERRSSPERRLVPRGGRREADYEGRPLVLVVDDHVDSRDLMAAVLQELGVAIAEAGTAAGALERVAMEPRPRR